MTDLPDAAALLRARAEQDREELEHVRMCVRDPRVDALARAGVRDRVDQLLDLGEKQLARIGSDGSDGWQDLAEARRRTGRVKRESLALVQGALLRDAALDGGLGAVADRMFRGLADRTGVDDAVVSTVGESEFLDRTLELVRTRFPDTSVWGLPILAHEFGHYVARALPHADPDLRGQVWPLKDLLSEEAGSDVAALAPDDDDLQHELRPRAAAHLGELFADVYATYALGACAPLAAIVLRANLGTGNDAADAASSSHPSWARRVATMCAALRAVSDLHDEPGPRLLAERQVEPLWRRVAGDAGRTDPLLRFAEPQARRIVEALDEHAPRRLRFAAGGQGPSLRALLDTPDSVTAASVPPGSTVSQVVHVAWQWRITNWSASPDARARVSRRALSLCSVASP